MKNCRTIFYASAAVALSLLAEGCGKTSPGTSSGYEVRVEPSVGGLTKGSFTSETLDSFDLYIANSRNSRYSYTNTRFTRGEDGKWTSERQMLWERPAGKPQNVKVLALCPPQETGGHSLDDTPIMNVEVETRQSADSRKSDILACIMDESEVSWNYLSFTSSGELRLSFDHKMSLLRLELSLGSEFNRDGVPEQNPVTDLKVDGTVVRGVFQQVAVDGGYYYKMQPLSGPAETVWPYEIEWRQAADATDRCRAVYECILFPQRDIQFTVSFMMNGIPYKWTSGTGVSFLSGMSRTLPLTVGKDEVVAGEMTANPWGNGGEKDIETE